jgi:serine/threonine-protein kinase
VTDSVARLATALADRYRIERELGAGGMATVYLAHDVRHDRKVALKVLRPELSAILGGERFLAEIKTTANLQHPHILSLFDSGEADGLVFYVMPYVEGESLRDRLTREKQLPVEDAVRIAREVADALEYAHQHGIVHRDIKPENILLHGGHAQVADFGIALAASRGEGGTRMTETGMSLGTPHYMSPEQSMGEREITPKADIYALGCVLYEMLTAEPPFTGATAQAIIARVMTEEPRSLTLQRKSIPPHVEAAVERALEKLPADRWASAAQFAEALQGGGPGDRGTGGPRMAGSSRPAVPRSRGPALFAAAALSGVVLGALGLLAGWQLARPGAEPPRPVRFTLAFPDSARYVDTFGRSIAISPDGSALVYSGGVPGRRQLFLRRLDEPRPTPIEGTEGAYMPFFSPDGTWLGFVANQRVMKVRLAGGVPITVAQLLGNTVSGATWGSRDVIVLEDVSGLSRVNAAGGRLEVLTTLDSVNSLVEWPTFLPDGDAVLCAVTLTRNDASYLGLVRLSDGRVTVFHDFEGSDPRFLPPGLVVWTTREGVMLAAPFDARRHRFTGTPVAVLEGVTSEGGAAKVGLGPGIAVRVEGGQQRSQLLRLDRHGTARPERPELMNYLMPRFSPDGRRIAVLTGLNEGIGIQGELWVLDRARGTRQRLTLASPVGAAEWSPDGRRLAFAYLPGPSWDVYEALADGSGAAESLVTRPGTEFPAGWAPGGAFIFWRQTQNRGDILYLDSAGGAEHAFAASPANELTPTLSPDGHWLAFVSDESGRREVYVRPFPTGEGRWQISTDGGIEPRWSKNGREIVFRAGDWFLSVPVVAGPGISTGQVDSLFRGPYSTTALRTQYDVSRDGSEFIIVGAPAASRTLAVTLNPFEALRSDRRRSSQP